MPTSVFWPDHRRTTFPALDGEVTCDVVVVGAGVVGLTTALLLGREGLSVRVLEAARVGDGCTGRSSAKISVVHGLKAATLTRRYGEQVARTYLEANTAGAALLREEALGAPEASLELRPATLWTEDEKSVQDLLDEAAALRSLGVQATDLAGPDVGLAGPVLAGFRVEDQAQVDPRGLLQVLAGKVAALRGCEVHEQSRVTGVHDAPLGRGTARVETADGVVHARHVVLATQVPFLDRGLWFAQVEPYRSHQIAVRTTGPVPEDLLLRVGGPTRSVRTAPDAAGRVVLVGGEGHKTGQGGDTRERVAALVAFAEERFGAVEVLHQWAAQDYVPVDGLPSVGPLWPVPTRLLVATGFAKWGLSNGAAAAMLLRDRVLDKDNPWAATFAPRPHLSAGTARAAVQANGNVARNLVTGWVGAVTRGAEEPAEGEGHVERHAIAPVATCRVDGVVHRVSGICPHLGGIVSWNAAERSWDCPLHGSRFAADGTRLEGPAVRDL